MPLRPASLAVRAYDTVLRQIPVDEAWVEAIRALVARGPVVYVLRNVSLVDLLALDALTRRFGLPPLGFANELGAWVEAPAWSLKKPSAEERIRHALEGGQSAVLFLKRPPERILPRPGNVQRGRSGGDEPLRALLAMQREATAAGRGKDIMLVPQTFLWTQRPGNLRVSFTDTLFGPAEFPGELRAAAQVLLNYKHCAIRAGEPVRLGAFLAEQEEAREAAKAAGTSEEAAGAERALRFAEASTDDAVLARRLTYALLRRLERERRAMVGPAQKPADRVREEVLRSPKLQAVIRELAGSGDEGRLLLEQKARRTLRSLQADPDPATLRGLEMLADTLASRVYAGIDVDKEGIERVREAARRGSIVLLPSHKSHVDYLLMSWVLRKHALQLPVVAAGDNLSFFPVGPLFRRAGAFFIRRSFKGDRLYAAVVDAYIRRLLRDGYAIEFFLEGGRSRTGKLLPPKLGLLNMVVEAGLALENRTISFVPISIGYERMMEEGSFARELSGGVKQKESVGELLKIGSVLQEKYGRANMEFGQILTLDEMREAVGIAPGEPVPPAKRRALVTRLAHRVMSEMNRATLVTPGSLVATALLCHSRRGLPHVELLAQCERLTALLRRLGARTAPSLTRPSGEMRELAVREAALLYVRGGLVRQHVPGDTLTGKARKRARIYTGDDVIYTVPQESRILLDLAKNVIVHLLVDRALISTALLAHTEGQGLAGEVREARDVRRPPTRAELEERVRSLSRLFKLEFMFRADAPFEQIFEETSRAMAEDGEIAFDGDVVRFGPGREGLDGRGWVGFYASVLRNFLEGYRIAARAARVLVKGGLTEKELVGRALQVGEQMFLGAEIERSEAVSRPVIENALAAFVDQGYLRREEGKLVLAESFASEEAVQTIEGRIAGYLQRRSGDLGW
ncbi:1-acyl-sn-glycerol-3-phosphate acyltransferase [Chondromyces apiculatus]|uniref:Glycerol-3-phosphate acyltransferase n=1 Tax=Chondromyces apiculatus DSM 436 TaxID=1192034 RepID=A0A017T9K8_9BACT|nr:1-acyl-sn-glycerol-3-phosphate acyltransferase [Chondromyces apiculatus]EYF05958.1 Glycerol-3-phosphate acyltransferase [Chondromyces apiculatus DSM 436]